MQLLPWPLVEVGVGVVAGGIVRHYAKMHHQEDGELQPIHEHSSVRQSTIQCSTYMITSSLHTQASPKVNDASPSLEVDVVTWLNSQALLDVHYILCGPTEKWPNTCCLNAVLDSASSSSVNNASVLNFFQAFTQSSPWFFRPISVDSSDPKNYGISKCLKIVRRSNSC